jgi:hypothetical protein
MRALAHVVQVFSNHTAAKVCDRWRDRWLAAIFATLVVAGAPDAFTTNLALLAFVNGVAIGQFIPRPPVRPIILIISIPPIIPIILIIPVIPVILILPIRGRFSGCHRRSRKTQAPE